MERWAKSRSALAAAALVAAAAAPRAVEARVVAFVVESRQPLVGGASWGDVGPYERLTGTAYMEVDPRDPLNAVIVDIDRAPQNARGMVEFSTPFVIAKPVDMARSNHKIFYGINNRGNNPFGLLTATTQAQLAASDVYFTMGYTLVDAGWEGDALQTATNLTANLPIARQADGSPIVGMMRVEYSDRNLPLTGAFTLVLEGNASFHSYETADTNTGHSLLTVRDNVSTPKTTIASDRWAFGKCPTGAASFVPSTSDICYFDGFRNKKIYELIYPAKNPIVMALGHATTRDVGSFLRYQAKDDAGNANPLGTGIPALVRDRRLPDRRVHPRLRLFRFQRGRVAPQGVRRRDADHRRHGPRVHQRAVRGPEHLVGPGRPARLPQTSYPPLTYGVTTDPVSGIRAGVLHRPATDPLVMQTDLGDGDVPAPRVAQRPGRNGRPVDVPENVRLYFNSSAAHSMRITGLRTNPAGSSALCANPTPGGTVIETARATLVAMDLWANQGIRPPRSNYPRVEEGTLIPLEEARSRFPAIPNDLYPTVQNQARISSSSGRCSGRMAASQPPAAAARPAVPAVRAALGP